MKPNLIRILAPIVVIAGTALTAHAQDRSRGGDTGGTERFFGYLDRNKDGKLDADEARRMPSSFREAFAERDIRIDRGMSKEQFFREMPRAMEDMRRRRESSSDDERRREEERRRSEERRREEERRRADGQRTSQPKTEFYTPRQSQPLTVNLPTRFEDGDSDQDGQIGYYEWRKWKPEAKTEFKLRDQNGDGFLTPRELLRPLPAVPTTTEVAAAAPTEGSPSTTGTNGTPSVRPGGDRERSFRGRGDRTGSRGGPVNSYPAPATAEKSISAEAKQTATAKYMFKTMDADKDGQISDEEWGKSRTIKPKFDAANIDMSQPMNESQFLAAYQKAFSP